VGYYSALKRKKVFSHEETWMNLKCIALSEGSQPEQVTRYMLPTIPFWKRQSYGGSKKISGC